jgi:DNA-binding transcriptional LysR family regulator
MDHGRGGGPGRDMTAAVDLNDLSVFVAVAESATFSAAAARLAAPKSSVSRAIARLEAALGVRLVHRTTRHQRLSTAGTALYEKVAVHLASLGRSLGELPELEEQPSGRLRVTAAADFAAAVLADVVARFVLRYPSVEVDLVLSSDIVDLVASGIDVALRVGSRRLKDSSLRARRAGAVAIQLFASPSYLARRGTPRTPRELAGHEWVRFRGLGSLQLVSSGARAQVATAGRIIADDLAFVRAALQQGAGIGTLPLFLGDADVAAGLLMRVLPRWRLPGGDLWLVTPSGRHVPRKVSAFVEFVLEALRARFGDGALFQK